MSRPFSHPVIAVVWDFDKTLIPGMSNDILHELRAELTFHPGMPELVRDSVRGTLAEVDPASDDGQAPSTDRRGIAGADRKA